MFMCVCGGGGGGGGGGGRGKRDYDPNCGRNFFSYMALAVYDKGPLRWQERKPAAITKCSPLSVGYILYASSPRPLLIHSLEREITP